MKFNYLIALITISVIAFSCQPGSKKDDPGDSVAAEEMTYDSALAQSLGADEYGMKKYVIAFLKRGPNQDLDSAEAAQLQRAHLDNIFRLADEGKLALAGPFLDTGDIRGIYIFNVETVEEAKTLTETDPAIQAGRFAMELHPWYGSAATMMVNDWHKKVQKESI